jgi:hypothetical protein
MSTGGNLPGVKPYSSQRGCTGKRKSERDFSLMIKRLMNWLTGNATPGEGRGAQQRRRVSAHAALHVRATPTPALRQHAGLRELGPTFDGRIESAGPGKNVLVSNGDAVDDTGAREMLKLFDDVPPDPGEPAGIDPYNTGEFDRSRNWDTRFRN